VSLVCCAIFTKIAREKSKYDNIRAIESVLLSLSKEAKQDLFAQFVEAGKNQSLIATNNFVAASVKPANGSDSLKRSSDAFKPTSEAASTKVLTDFCLYNYTKTLLEKTSCSICSKESNLDA
jgi:hypothetical protein